MDMYEKFVRALAIDLVLTPGSDRPWTENEPSAQKGLNPLVRRIKAAARVIGMVELQREMEGANTCCGVNVPEPTTAEITTMAEEKMRTWEPKVETPPTDMEGFLVQSAAAAATILLANPNASLHIEESVEFNTVTHPSSNAERESEPKKFSRTFRLGGCN